MSFRRFWILGLMSGLVVTLLFGCQSQDAVVDAPPARQPIKKKVDQNNNVKKVMEEQESEKPVPVEYAYDPAGRRDPFVPLLEVKKAIPTDDGPLTPLQTFDVGQLRLAGVVVGHSAPIAMVMVPGGKSYILKKGDKVGKNHGTVIDINEQSVLVKERYYDFAGEIRENVQEILLPKRSGVD